MNKQTKIWLLGFSIVVLLLLWIALTTHVLMPFVMALLLAFLTNPLIEMMVQWHVPRTLAVSMVFVGLAVLILIIVLTLVPLLQQQCQYLLDQFPRLLAWAHNDLEPWLKDNFSIELQMPTMVELKQQLLGQWKNMGNVLGMALSYLSKSSLAIINTIVNLILIPVVLFYALRDWHALGDGVRALLPRAFATTLLDFWREATGVLGAFFRGQLIVMCCLGLFYALCLSFLGLALGLLIGLLAGLLSVVPYLGFFGGLLFALVESYLQFNDAWHYLMVFAIFGLGNVVEGMILTPNLIGDKIGLHPVAVIFSVLAGGQLFGFMGVLLALPVAAVVMVLIQFFMAHYRRCDVETKSAPYG